jgi:phosphoglucosamine mutase
VAQLLEGVQLYPQTLVNVRLAPGQDWKQARGLADAQQALEGRLAGKGRVLIRASGTEPVVRVMVEAQDEALARDGAHALADAIRAG